MKNSTTLFCLAPKVCDGEDGDRKKMNLYGERAPRGVSNGLNVWPAFKFSNAIYLNLPPRVANLSFHPIYSSLHTHTHIHARAHASQGVFLTVGKIHTAAHEGVQRQM